MQIARSTWIDCIRIVVPEMEKLWEQDFPLNLSFDYAAHLPDLLSKSRAVPGRTAAPLTRACARCRQDEDSPRCEVPVGGAE